MSNDAYKTLLNVETFPKSVALFLLWRFNQTLKLQKTSKHWILEKNKMHFKLEFLFKNKSLKKHL